VSFLLLVVSAAFLFLRFKSYKQAGLGIMLCLGLMNYQFLPNFALEKLDAQLYVKNPDETFHIVRGEWLPSRVDKEALMAAVPAMATRTDGMKIKGTYDNKGDFFLPVSGEMGIYEIPLIWYLGYEAVLKRKDESAMPLPLRGNERGFVELLVPPSASAGTLHITYAGTEFQRIANRVSAASLLAYLLYLLLFPLRRRFCHACAGRQIEGAVK